MAHSCLRFLTAALLTALAACDDGAADAPVFDEAAALEAMTHYADGDLVLLNATPLMSSAAPGKSIRVFATKSIADDYRDLAAGTTILAPGAIIVRELSDASGTVVKLTATARGESGSNPEAGDLWFAVTSPTGEPLMDAEGHEMVGALAECSSCHHNRAATDYLFGLPTP